ncbi:MAG: hypothetical protein ABR507_04770 [Actinomycetota bacterium]|nr:hypothetical protein [Actinomycetota bacterium]
MTGPIFAVLLIVGLGLWVMRPFASRRQRRDPEENTSVALLDAKQAVYRSLVDLELDHKLGKVSDGDHADLRREHEHEAIEIIRQLDADASDVALEDRLEEEISEARRRLNRGR